MPRTTLEELSNQCSSKMVGDGAEMKKTELDVLQRQRNKGPTDWQSVGRGIVPARDNLYISQQKSTHECERMVAETPEERKRLQRMSTNHTEERELRLECYSTRYMEHQSVQLQLPLFNSIPSKPRCKNSWLHWMHRHAPLVQKNFLASISSQSLMHVCIVVVTCTFLSCTPLPTTWTLALSWCNVVADTVSSRALWYFQNCTTILLLIHVVFYCSLRLTPRCLASTLVLAQCVVARSIHIARILYM